MNLFIIVLLLDAFNFAGNLFTNSFVIIQLALLFLYKTIFVDLWEALLFCWFLLQITALFRRKACEFAGGFSFVAPSNLKEFLMELILLDESLEKLLKLFEKNVSVGGYFRVTFWVVKFKFDGSRRFDLPFDHFIDPTQIRIFFGCSSLEFDSLFIFGLSLYNLVRCYFFYGLFRRRKSEGLWLGSGDIKSWNEMIMVISNHRIYCE